MMVWVKISVTGEVKLKGFMQGKVKEKIYMNYLEPSFGPNPKLALV